MFETVFKDNVIGTETVLPISEVLLCIAVALVLGVLIGTTYAIIAGKNNRSQSLFVSVIVLPILVAVIIMMISGNLARAFSMAGVFTLVRFRSMPGDAKDISFVFSSMAVGIAAGLGYLTIGAVLTVILCVIFIVIYKLGMGGNSSSDKLLRIVIPEDLNYEEIFTDLFEKYTNKCSLKKVRTTNLGALYELSYLISLKKDVSVKSFMDDLRCRNGNLVIMISSYETEAQGL